MGRGRPRGNRTQRDIGRAVGKGLKGKEPPQFNLTTLIWVAGILLLMGLLSGEFMAVLSILPVVLALFFLLFWFMFI